MTDIDLLKIETLKEDIMDLFLEEEATCTEIQSALGGVLALHIANAHDEVDDVIDNFCRELRRQTHHQEFVKMMEMSDNQETEDTDGPTRPTPTRN